MNLRDIVRRVLLGPSLPNEYVCTTPDWISKPLHVYVWRNELPVDVTNFQLLLGYKPLTIGLAVTDPGLAGWLTRRDEIQLTFATDVTSAPAASLVLKRAAEWRMGDANLIVFTGQRGEHQFLTGFYRFTNRCYEFLRPYRQEYGSMKEADYNQVRIAYSVPRNISVMSVGQGDLFNFFPTDLQGSVGSRFFVGSLRVGGKACGQVEHLKHVVISSIGVDNFKDVYALAKNHMNDLRSPANFSIADVRSEQWQLPIPKQAISYKELLWKSSWDVGIHRVHFYEIVNERVLDGAPFPLAHVHRYYVQWRLRNKLSTKYLLR